MHVAKLALRQSCLVVVVVQAARLLWGSRETRRKSLTPLEASSLSLGFRESHRAGRRLHLDQQPGRRT